MAKFEERARFEMPSNIDEFIVGIDFKGELIRGWQKDDRYYYITSQDEYVAVDDLKKYLKRMFVIDTDLAEYATDVLKEIMLEDNEMEVVTVDDIKGRI